MGVSGRQISACSDKKTNGTVCKNLKDGGTATVYRIYLYLLF